MKRMLILLTGCCFALSSLAQTDTTGKSNQNDTIHVGGMIIVKKGKTNGDEMEEIIVHHRNHNSSSSISTDWGIFDIGFANFNDKTDYAAASNSGYLGPGVGQSQFNLRNGKSVNVNLWVFMQKLNIYKHVVNLKYGAGLELNNYRYEETRLTYLKNPAQIVLIDSPSHTKNKLAADYFTIPMMINFNFTPQRDDGFGLSFGVSAGYLYSSRQKFKGGEGDKYKTKGNFELEPWKISYIAELQLGPIKFYGSYAMKSIYKKALDHTPYNVGVRLSNSNW
jgi:hypothetical protein